MYFQQGPLENFNPKNWKGIVNWIEIRKEEEVETTAQPHVSCLTTQVGSPRHCVPLSLSAERSALSCESIDCSASSLSEDATVTAVSSGGGVKRSFRYPASSFTRFSSLIVDDPLPSSLSTFSSSSSSFKILTWNLNDFDVSFLSTLSSCFCHSKLSSYHSEIQSLISLKTNEPSFSGYTTSKTNTATARKLNLSTMSEQSYNIKVKEYENKTMAKLFDAGRQLHNLNADVIFIQEMKNSCSMKMLVYYMNFLAHQERLPTATKGASHPVPPFPLDSNKGVFVGDESLYEYACVMDVHSCLLDLSLDSLDTFFLKGIIYRPSRLLFHPLLFVPDVDRSCSLARLSSDRFRLSHTLFPLGSCAFSALIYPRPLLKTNASPTSPTTRTYSILNSEAFKRKVIEQCSSEELVAAQEADTLLYESLNKFAWFPTMIHCPPPNSMHEDGSTDCNVMSPSFLLSLQQLSTEHPQDRFLTRSTTTLFDGDVHPQSLLAQICWELLAATPSTLSPRASSSLHSPLSSFVDSLLNTPSSFSPQYLDHSSDPLSCFILKKFSSFSPLLKTRIVYSSLANIFATCVHLRSMKDPTNVYVRENQVIQLKRWLRQSVFANLFLHRVRVSHWMVLGDMNDYDNVVRDKFNNSNEILGRGISEHRNILTLLKSLYLFSCLCVHSGSCEHCEDALRASLVNHPQEQQQQQLSFFCPPRSLINTASLRPLYTRFTNSFFFDLKNPRRFSGSLCHILISENFEQGSGFTGSAEPLETARQSTVAARRTTSSYSSKETPTSVFVTEASKDYLRHFYCSKLLPMDVNYILKLLNFDSFSHSHLKSISPQRLINNYNNNNANPLSNANSMNSQGALHHPMEENLFLKQSAVLAAASLYHQSLSSAKIHSLYFNRVRNTISYLENRYGVYDVNYNQNCQNTTERYPSDHVPVQYWFSLSLSKIEG